MWILFTLVAFLGLTSNIESLPVENPIVRNEDYFLPDSVIIPSNYKVTIDVSESFPENEVPTKFAGNVEITATVNKATKQIILHATGTSERIIQITSKNKPVEIESDDDQSQKEKEFLLINLKNELNAGSNIKINIKYIGTLYNDMNGFYVSSYLEDEKTEYVLTTQFEPTKARRAFPCFDEPKYKATFDVVLVVPKGGKFNVLCNTPGHFSTENTFTCNKTPKMSTYLVAFVVSKFKYQLAPVPETKNLKVWAKPDSIKQTEVAAKAMKPIIDALDNYTQIKYDNYLKKMDLIALPDFSAGAMENWGLLTFRETALLVDETVSTNRDVQRVVSVIAHEIAHQWFGDLVTLTWWDNTWLNEGFATYFEYMITDEYKKGDNWEMENQFVLEELQSVFAVDALEKTTPLTHKVFKPDEISSHFGSISYNKGGSVIRMMKHFLGEDLFRESLQNYLNTNKLQNSLPNNLWDSIEKKVNELNLAIDFTIEKIMSTWISQPGFPLVTVEIVDDKITFYQQRFLFNPINKRADNQKWYIPISFTTSDENDFENTKPKLWLTPNEENKTILSNKPEWVVANIKQNGYYRVNYNKENWNALAAALKTEDGKKFDKINRAQIIDDVMNLARAGVVEYNTAFNVADYLETETDYFPWYSAFRAFRFLLQRYSETDTTGIKLREYLLKLMTSLIKDTNFDNTEKLNQIEVYNKVNALEWACNLGHEKLVEEAVNKFNKEIDNIDKNLRSTVYCTAIRNSDETVWEKLWEKYNSSNVAAEKAGIIPALGCSNDTKILNKFLMYSIEENGIIRSQDASSVFSAVYTGNPIGVEVAFSFLKEHNADIIKHYGGLNALNNAVLGLAGRLTSDSEVKELEKILNGNENFNNIKEAAIETANDNINWAKKYGDSIVTELDQRNSAFSFVINKFALCLSLGFVTIYFTKFSIA